MARSVQEWVAKHDDQKVPPRVRLRVFEAHGGVCYLSGRKIMPGEKWELEHVKALIHGGEHREANLRPALIAPHKVKTAEEMAIKAKTDAIRKRHLGITRPAGTIKSQGFAKTSKPEKQSRWSWAPKLQSQLFEEKERT